MAAIESSSSCGPQPKDQPPPPTAQEPNPTVVISRPLLPSCRFLSAMGQILPVRTSFRNSMPNSRIRRRVASELCRHGAFDCTVFLVVTFQLRLRSEEPQTQS